MLNVELRNLVRTTKLLVCTMLISLTSFAQAPAAAFAGGSYDGFSLGINTVCSFTASFTRGGSYDGSNFSYTTGCDFTSGFSRGGSYDGANFSTISTCTFSSGFTRGGSYDGSNFSTISTCTFSSGFTRGGSYDGANFSTISTCTFTSGFARGGSYDGSNFSTISTCTFSSGFTRGGSYDGNNFSTQTGCSFTTGFSRGGSYDGFSSFSLCAPSDALPITLLSFSGKNEGQTNLLEWITASEINNDYFTLERSSDAQNFGFVGKVKGAGNSTSQLHYSFTDDRPYLRTYYRLKQTDYDGKFSYSDIIVLNLVSADGIIIYPNPVTDLLNIVYSGEEGKSFEIELYNVEGGLIYNTNSYLEKENGSITIPFNSLASGVYFISIASFTENSSTDSGSKIYRKIIKVY